LAKLGKRFFFSGVPAVQAIKVSGDSCVVIE